MIGYLTTIVLRGCVGSPRGHFSICSPADLFPVIADNTEVERGTDRGIAVKHYFFSPAAQFDSTVNTSAEADPATVSSRKRLPSEVTSYSNWLFTGDDIEVRFGRAALTRVGVLLYQTVLSDEGPV